jgi:hypothetical protein
MIGSRNKYNLSSKIQLEQLQLQSAAIPNRVNLPLSSAAVDANRLGDKKIAYSPFKLILF